MTRASDGDREWEVRSPLAALGAAWLQVLRGALGARPSDVEEAWQVATVALKSVLPCLRLRLHGE
jgi:hypothetical protein